MSKTRAALYMPDDRYLAALKRQRERIAAGLDVVAIDSDVTGDKYTTCSWGLCSKDREAWPDAVDHLWPDQFEKDGRVAPRYRNKSQPCPIDDDGPANGGTGCFYSCSIFQAATGAGPSRAEILARYDALITKAEA